MGHRALLLVVSFVVVIMVHVFLPGRFLEYDSLDTFTYPNEASNKTKETWNNGNFLSIDGFTNFEDDREYKIDGKDENGIFRATGMDGLLELDENIVPLNYWNKQMLKEKEVFDTQKGIVRKISVKKFILNVG